MAPAGDEIHPPTIPDTADTVCAPEDVGRTGYGELVGGEFSQLTGLYGADPSEINDYPPDIKPLEKAMWYNHSLRSEMTPLITNTVADNRRVWQDMEIEKRLDYHPPYEVHPDNLPNYHYWPSIQNELNHKPNITPAVGTNAYLHAMDKTDVPRFFRTGAPKTPVQEQDWFVPLTQEGRFDWRANICKNGYAASLFSRAGWDKRFHLSLNRPMLPMHLLGLRQFVQHPIFFRMNEHPFTMRIVRHVSAINFDRHMWFMGLYLGFICMASAGDAHWRKLNWVNEPWNYDLKFCQYNRDKGGFHGIV